MGLSVSGCINVDIYGIFDQASGIECVHIKWRGVNSRGQFLIVFQERLRGLLHRRSENSDGREGSGEQSGGEREGVGRGHSAAPAPAAAVLLSVSTQGTQLLLHFYSLGFCSETRVVPTAFSTTAAVHFRFSNLSGNSLLPLTRRV